MSPTEPIFTFFQNWGWTGVALYFLLTQGWPFLKERLGIVDQRLAQEMAAEQKKEDRITEAQLATEKAELDFQHTIQIRREENVEKLVTSIQELTNQIAHMVRGQDLTNERIANMQTAQLAHDQFATRSAEAIHTSILQLHSMADLAHADIEPGKKNP